MVVLLITALVLSTIATYITITKINEASITGNFNQASVGLFVKPARQANVGVTVLPPEEKEEGKK